MTTDSDPLGCRINDERHMQRFCRSLLGVLCPAVVTAVVLTFAWPTNCWTTENVDSGIKEIRNTGPAEIVWRERADPNPQRHDCPPQRALQSTSMSPTDDPEVFIDDDDGYLVWLSDHVRGYVLNATRKPTASYLMLHRADCSTIGNVPANGLVWTSDLLKACSDDPTHH